VAFSALIGGLKDVEGELSKQLEGVRAAIVALETGIPGSPTRGAHQPVRRRRRLSAKARAAISRAQKLRWARQRRAKQ
jgi:hypothetical protein